MITFLYLFLAGLIGGFVAGLVGIGGGIIYIFIIPLALRFMGAPEQEIAQYTIANSIFAIFFASASVNYTQIKMNNFYLRPVLIIGVFAIVTSLLTLQFVVNTSWYSAKVFNIVVIILLVYMLAFTLFSAKKNHRFPLSKLKIWHFATVGLTSGVVASVSGLGGGIVIIPVMNTLMKVDIKKASSVSSGVIMISAVVMTIFNMAETTRSSFQNYSIGYIVFPIVFALAAGVLIASPYGVRTAVKLSSKNISYIYASFLTIVILKKVIELIYVYK